MTQDRYLCSHLVWLRERGRSDDEPFPALLEEISAKDATLGLEEPLPEGLELEMTTDSYAIPGRVVSCTVREADFELAIEFVEGREWNRAEWQPEHLYLPRPTAAAKAAAN